MFTIDQIKTAHAKVKSGADFPNYISDIIQLGVLHYTTYVTDGHTEFTGAEGHNTSTEAKYPAMTIAATANNDQLKHDLSAHQQGQSDYLTFCTQAAAAGVEKWVVDTTAMTCTYYDRSGVLMLQETIPG